MAASTALRCTLAFILCFANPTAVLGEKQTYIVHMDAARKPAAHATHGDWYAAHLQSLSIAPERHLLYTYTHALQGFAASLDPHHLPLLRSHPSVLHLHPDPLLTLHTTRTPQFLGLYDSPAALLQAAEVAARDVVVGVLDTGVWPESPSFNDAGLPRPPSRWRGECEVSADFPASLCNKKLVGARSFSRGFRASPAAAGKSGEFASPRDRDGHGTHTASTAAGAAVANASLLGYAPGTARGIAAGARVAAYKVCWSSGCFGSDVLAGLDRAISDGVDVLSLSLGGGASPYYRDTIAAGTFAAAERGIFVSCSAGNNGPRAGSLANTAPWIATVGAGTLDRDFPAHVTLGDSSRHDGVSLYSGRGRGRGVSTPAPLVYLQGGGNTSNLCLPGTLDRRKVRGRVVLCDRGLNARVEKGEVVRKAGGVGMVLANSAANGEELVADSHVLPALAVGNRAGEAIRKYVLSDPNPTVVIGFGGTVLGVRPSPVVAAFSSRGPNVVTPRILKPDLVGPGVNILAGWSGSTAPTGLDSDRRRTDFNIMSGTSMSCPHISGLAALLKAAHPDWSPAAIKSALMTTAYTVDNTGAPLRDAAGGSTANSYAYGAGHVDPQKALSPGLIYDITAEDYVSFLCSLKYTPAQIRAVTSRANISCAGGWFRNPGNLNYPSFSVVFGRKVRAVRYARELTNVGMAPLTYHVKVEGPAFVDVRVKPETLVFTEVGKKLRYTVTFASGKAGGGDPAEAAEFGWITWLSKEHQVRSPVAYRWSG